jgi:hypothetical protein
VAAGGSGSGRCTAAVCIKATQQAPGVLIGCLSYLSEHGVAVETAGQVEAAAAEITARASVAERGPELGGCAVLDSHDPNRKVKSMTL